ncbi:molybdopterin molybdotransferase MoeA [Dehalococcoidia bacterium]|nr:molybdopterin molybdotransferase MoeA [Dehalococcoidia bacterium]
MISVEEALEKILSNVSVLEPEEKPILDSLGQVLAEDVCSDIDVPPLDNSAMDGYAVQWEDIRGATISQPRTLSVIGEVAAGYISDRTVVPGTAIRIMTGAPVPAGADSVVQFEDTDEEVRKAAGKPLDEIGIGREVVKGSNIRRAGEDITRGSLVLASGMVLRPQEIGVLASLGRANVLVIRRPTVAVLATGDELVEVGRPLPPGKIYNSNTYSIATQVRRYGAIPHILGIATDEKQELMEKITRGMDSDLLITSAGVSRGDYDIVKDVLAELGEISFWTVRMKPGKPLAFGILAGNGKKVPHLGFPGNPVSSMIAFEQFARPAILKMLGKTNLAKPTVSAISESRIENANGRRIFARAIVRKRDGRYFACVAGPQGSGILTSMSGANGLLVVPEDVGIIEVGDEVSVQMLDWREEDQVAADCLHRRKAEIGQDHPHEGADSGV